MPATSLTDKSALMFRAEVQTWIGEAVPPDWRELLSQSMPESQMLKIRGEWDRLMAAGGYAGLSWPRAFGGRGFGPIEEFIFYEEVGRAGTPDMLNFIGFDLAGPAIIAHGTEDQKQTLLPRILSCEDLWCEGFSEPNAGSDLASVSTTAVLDEPSRTYLVSGQKVWTSLAQLADRCYLLAKTSQAKPRHHNLSLLLMDMRVPGVDPRPIRQATGGSEFCELFLDNVAVPADRLLGEKNNGWQLATLAGFRMNRRIFDALRRSVVIERMVGQLERCATAATRETMLSLRADTDLLRWHILRCVELAAQGRESNHAAAILRVVWSKLWQRVVDAGVETRCAEHDDFWRTEYLFARSVTIAGGTEQIQRNVIADRIIGLPR
jgi:alkylation response protein AidB-like acyl-CoA dehydrogenase